MRGKRLLMRDAELIRVFAEFGFTTGQIAREYEVHPDTIRNVVGGISFRPDGRRAHAQYKHRKLNADQVRFIRELAGQGHGEQAIARKLGNVVARATVRQVMTGKTYQDVQ